MTNKMDPVELARELGEIARTTTDPETGRRLAELVKRLLAAAGLPPDDEPGGGETPTEWVHQIARVYGQPLTRVYPARQDSCHGGLAFGADGLNNSRLDLRVCSLGLTRFYLTSRTAT